MVIDDGGGTATEVAGGVVNPVVLKRFNPVWRAKDFLPKASQTYEEISKRLGVRIINPAPLYRILNSVEEQNDWTVASDRRELSAYLSSEIVQNQNPSVQAPYGLGQVNGALQLYPAKLLAEYGNYLDSQGLLLRERFDHSLVENTPAGVTYKNIKARYIIYCEGISALKNPSFPKDALIPNKGEYGIIEAPSLAFEGVLKGPMFVIPYGTGTYKVGATFSRDETSLTTTEDAAERIVAAFQKMVDTPFQLVGQVAGVRPTTKDRRPLLGRFPAQQHTYILNGLGSRGLLMAPLLAQWLFDLVEHGVPVPPEVALGRFAG